MRHVQDEHDPAAVGLLEDLVFVGVVDFDAPVLFPGDQLVVDSEVDIAFGHFDSQVVAHAGVDAEVCGGTCVFGFMIEKNAVQPMLPMPARLPRNSAIPGHLRALSTWRLPNPS